MARRKLIPDVPWPRATLFIVTLETVITLVLESLVLREHVTTGVMPPPTDDALSTPFTIYPVVFLFAIVSLFTLCVDAIYHRNQIQVVAFTFFNILCCAYAIIQTLTDWTVVGVTYQLLAFNLAISVTMGVSSLFLILCAFKLARVFGWEMYRFLGADLKMRKMHKAYEILITLLKFDVFFFVGFAIQMFSLVGTSDHTFIGTIGGRQVFRQHLLVGLSIPASVLLLVLAFFGVMKENKIVSIIVIFCLAAAEPYFIYQLVYLHLPANQDKFKDSRKYLTFFISVTLMLVLLTLFFMMYCYRNYGKGLLISEKSRILTPKKPFEIDEDPVESEPSIPLEYNHGDDGATQNLMAYPALKKIQETYHIKPSSGHSYNTSAPPRGSGSSNPRSFDDKMEIE
ncbi:hypothetical protein BGZ95_008649 [Linnemannia exigua]|uniref:Uncharacterized protein n=1 Tax=Linnemannia exigua TaxID=604196 RepID=A0AAD4DE16_9FUNG|nr:hypothetical protein BGZ95_008649 [Linnemannia exigua]